MIEQVSKYLVSFSSGAWSDIRSMLSVDCSYEDMPSRRRSVGPDACLATLQRWKTAFPDMRASLIRSYAAGDRVCCEIEWSGTHTGTLDHSFGVIAPSHRSCRIKAVMTFTVKSGRISEISSYFDLLSVLVQLGVAPTFDPRAHGSAADSARP